MHSHTLKKNLSALITTVLILVVMEDALAHIKLLMEQNFRKVLILVVMEDALALFMTF